MNIKSNSRTKQVPNIKSGQKKFDSVIGPKEDIMASFRKISPDFADYCLGFIYGDLFLRKGINDKTRFLAIIGSLIGQGNTGFQLRRYIRGAMNVGWTKKEIIEIIIILSAYAGFPSTVAALYTAEEVFAEFKHNNKKRSSSKHSKKSSYQK